MQKWTEFADACLREILNQRKVDLQHETSRKSRALEESDEINPFTLLRENPTPTLSALNEGATESVMSKEDELLKDGIQPALLNNLQMSNSFSYNMPSKEITVVVEEGVDEESSPNKQLRMSKETS